MTGNRLPDEQLVAYVDGELDEIASHRVEAAALTDPTILFRLVSFVRSRRLTRLAFRKPTEDSDKLADKILALAAQSSERRSSSPKTWTRWASVAASVSVLALAGAGFLLMTSRDPVRGEPLFARLANQAVSSELSTLASGQERALSLGRLRLVSTYRIGDDLCRAFNLAEQSDGAEALSCLNERQWTLRIAIAIRRDSKPPSGGVSPFDAYLQQIGAGTPLDSNAEALALKPLASSRE